MGPMLYAADRHGFSEDFAMPFFKTSGKLVFYAHVPKCGGVSITDYLSTRFGPVAFSDSRHMTQPEALRWTRTSPQHVDTASLARLLPPGMIDACFTIVRHPVARLVSIYHFQKEVERAIDADMGFSDWLARAEESLAADRFRYDNHLRPMDEIVPEGATVFHMEHGLDALIPWLDRVAGNSLGPRAIPHENIRGQYVRAEGGRAQPSDEDIRHIARLYAVDFHRFGYDPGGRAPKAPAPVLEPGFAAARDRDLRRMNHPVSRLFRKVRRKLG